MVKEENLFSQITDKRFYEGQPWQTWNVTDNITITNSSQSYTTTFDYEGEIDTTSTRYGPQGIEYYTYTTTTSGEVSATVHPYEYVSTTSQKNVDVVMNTSSSDSYSVIAENSVYYSFVQNHYFYYQIGRVADVVYDDVTISQTVEGPVAITSSWWEIMSVSNSFDDSGLDRTETLSVDDSNLTNNTIRVLLFDGGESALPAPVRWNSSFTFNVAITYSSFETATTSKIMTYSFATGWNREKSEYSMSVTGINSYTDNLPYLTYSSKSTSRTLLTTIRSTYEVQTQTTTSWVEPRQVSSLISA